MFVFLLVIAASALAATGAFFSIFGLTKLFTASFISIIVMGSALEFGKLMSASFLYRYWGKISFVFKTYLIFALMVLMTITSVGIFGYLSASYQTDSAPITVMQNQLSMYKNNLEIAQQRKQQIDTTIANTPSDYITAKQRLIKTYAPDIKILNNTINSSEEKIINLQKKLNDQNLKIGPILYVAETLHLNPDKTIFYFILLLIIVFDPLAVTLTVAANMAILDRVSKKNTSNVEPEETKPVVITNTIPRNDYQDKEHELLKSIIKTD